MKISVILQNYNYAQYVGDAIESILRQTEKPDQFIIIDDASTDDSQNIIQRYVDRYPHIEFHKNIQNLGICKTCNESIALAKNEFVALLASDDIYLPTFIEETKKAASKFPHARLFCSDFCFFNENNLSQITPFPKVFSSPKTTFLAKYPLIKAMRTYKFWISSPAVFHKDYFYKFHGYMPELEMYMDFFLLAIIAFDTGVCYIPKMLRAMRVHGSQFSSNLKLKQKERAWKEMLKKFKKTPFKAFSKSFRKSHLLYHFEVNFFYFVLKRPQFWYMIDFSLWKKLGIQWRRQKIDPQIKKLSFSSRSKEQIYDTN